MRVAIAGAGNVGRSIARELLEDFEAATDAFWLVKPKAATLDSLLKD